MICTEYKRAHNMISSPLLLCLLRAAGPRKGCQEARGGGSGGEGQDKAGQGQGSTGGGQGLGQGLRGESDSMVVAIRKKSNRHNNP